MYFQMTNHSTTLIAGPHLVHWVRLSQSAHHPPGGILQPIWKYDENLLNWVCQIFVCVCVYASWTRKSSRSLQDVCFYRDDEHWVRERAVEETNKLFTSNREVNSVRKREICCFLGRGECHSWKLRRRSIESQRVYRMLMIMFAKTFYVNDLNLKKYYFFQQIFAQNIDIRCLKCTLRSATK